MDVETEVLGAADADLGGLPLLRGGASRVALADIETDVSVAAEADFGGLPLLRAGTFGVAAVDTSIEVLGVAAAAAFDGLPLFLRGGATEVPAVVSASRTARWLARPRNRARCAGSSEKDTLLLGEVRVRSSRAVRIDFGLGGRPRFLGPALEAALVSAEVKARMAGVVRLDLGGLPRFFG